MEWTDGEVGTDPCGAWIPLPEIPPPPEVDANSICPLPGGSRLIWAEGTPSAAIMIVLDNPGAREDREGNPFVCGTRQTLLTCAEAAGIRREDLYVTWVLKRRPLRAYDKEGARAACLPYLHRQVEDGVARVIMLMGNVALQTVLANPALEVKALRGRILTYAERPVLCSYHPLAARRRPNLLPLVTEDLRLAARVAGLLTPNGRTS